MHIFFTILNWNRNRILHTTISHIAWSVIAVICPIIHYLLTVAINSKYFYRFQFVNKNLPRQVYLISKFNWTWQNMYFVDLKLLPIDYFLCACSLLFVKRCVHQISATCTMFCLLHAVLNTTHSSGKCCSSNLEWRFWCIVKILNCCYKCIKMPKVIAMVFCIDTYLCGEPQRYILLYTQVVDFFSRIVRGLVW